ncbi:MAG: hypothetical protein RJA70_3920, partial [Pseudomonadota bacterium]
PRVPNFPVGMSRSVRADAFDYPIKPNAS